MRVSAWSINDAANFSTVTAPDDVDRKLTVTHAVISCAIGNNAIARSVRGIIIRVRHWLWIIIVVKYFDVIAISLAISSSIESPRMTTLDHYLAGRC